MNLRERNKTVRTVIVGNRKLARQLLSHCFQQDWNVVGALAPEGTLATEQANFVPFEELVAGTNCELHTTSDINADATREWLQEVNPDICLCGGWSQIIESEILEIPSEYFLGFHSSRLPEGRGGAPVNWSLINGTETVWISLFEYVPAVDAGDVFARGAVPVEDRDDVATVFDALASEACRLVSTVRPELEKGIVKPEPQSLENATYRPRRQPQDGLIDWDHSSTVVYNWVKAQTVPYPGAYTFHDGTQLTVWRGQPVDDSADGAVPGEVVAIVDGEGVDIQTSDGMFRLSRVQPTNQPSRWADRYARDVGLSAGERLGRNSAPVGWLYTGLQRLLEPASFDTNLGVGETGTLELVSLAGASHELSIQVSVDAETIYSRSVVVEDGFRETVAYSFTKQGTHTVSVTFERDDGNVNTRYLKVFVHE